MPRRPGMRDDDLLARLDDVERRLDALEAAEDDADAPKARRAPKADKE